MKRNMLYAVIAALTLGFGGNAIASDDDSPPPRKAAKAKPKAPKKKAPTVKQVDINSAGKDELMVLPGVGAALADKIIAGRPYGSKAWLVSRNVMSATEFQALKDLVVAKQPYAEAEKNAAAYAPKKK